VSYTKDQVAQAIIAEGQTARTSGTPETLHPLMSPLQIQIALATALVESNDTVYANVNVPESQNYPHDAEGSDHMSTGPFQQQPQWWGTVAEEMDPRLSAAMFYNHLAKDMTAHPGRDPGVYAQDVQGSAFPDRYAQRMNDAVAQYNRLVGVGPVADKRIEALLAVRPDFNEFPNWCQNSQSRNGIPIDCLLVHTQEGAENDDNAALDLSNFIISSTGTNNPVSYHDSVHQASDGGVTVVNSVDTDYASWSVGNSNNRSINRCFAGSDASWTRAQWMTQAKAIDVMAYLMVLDALKYNIDISDAASITFGPNYSGRKPPVVSDHRYCTKVLQDGNTHTDVGDGFPVDIYGAAIIKYWKAANGVVAPPVTTDPPHPAIPPAPTFNDWLAGASELDLLRYIAAQMGPGDPAWNPQEVGKTMRDKVFGL
jgi:N-acetylmuramoyl-L-alanine amidase